MSGICSGSSADYEDKLIYVNFHCPYLSARQISDIWDVGTCTVTKWIQGINKLIPGRYPAEIVAGKKYNVYAILDWFKYKDILSDVEGGNHYIPEFNPYQWARMCGHTF